MSGVPYRNRPGESQLVLVFALRPLQPRPLGSGSQCSRGQGTGVRARAARLAAPRGVAHRLGQTTPTEPARNAGQAALVR
eukprot:g77644.t1